ncbi:(d)CMP kinase [Vallitalea sp.]|uniref:(d)CMP kinase n=1 Tax=Vallitalea sp. TaxID=1882829 RepID=UPI0025FBAB51|nr:(d)CMP kinase [Vallitalea sp.]MCT4688318.1 (d)CMP kinase [Vallitalea sp.]
MDIINIAIDGPAGAGKSTIAKKIAKELDIIYVDTGAMYRAFGLYCIRNNISSDQNDIINNILDDIDISICYIDSEQQVILNDENVNQFIRDEEVGKMASEISVNRNVRLKLVELQRNLATKKSIIMDGRDIGTYVLPNATTKIYLNASVETRAKRRHKELLEKGISRNLESIEDEISKRDYRDMNREFAPLKKADDAIEVDTSNLSIDEVVNKILKMINNNY